MNIHVLCDDRARRGFPAEHGLSLYVETKGGTLLFDMGQTDVFLTNAAKMDIDLSSVDKAMVSHGHYDHFGGARQFGHTDMDIVLHADALKPKYSHDPRTDAYDFRGVRRDELSASVQKHLCTITDDFRLWPNVWAITTKGRVGNPKYVVQKGDRMVPDDFHDEIILVVREDHRLHVVLGCCHVGLPMAIDAVVSAFPDDPIASVTGGLHLLHTDEETIRTLFKSMKSRGIGRLHPLHCSGTTAQKIAAEVFASTPKSPRAGDVFTP